MTAMIIYGFSVLFSPGPVTLVSLNKGFRQRFSSSFGYFLSIGTATYLLMLIYGYTGQRIIKKEYLTYIGILGCLYMFWLSYKMFHHDIALERDPSKEKIGFREGFLMQFFNPKASLAALPIATIQYPMNNIEGISVLITSMIFLIMGILSPGLYCFVGQYFSRFIGTEKWLNRFNKAMAVMLMLVAVWILYETVGPLVGTLSFTDFSPYTISLPSI